MYKLPNRCRARTGKNKMCKLKPQAGSVMCYIHRFIDLNEEEYDPDDYEMPNTASTLEDADNEIRLMIKNGLIDEAELVNLSVKCCCCFDQCDQEFTAMCADSKDKDYTDQHIACHDCIKEYMENIMQQKSQIKCMARNCKSTYDDLDIQPALNELYDSYKDYKLVDDVARLASLLDNYYMCPFCLRYGIIVDNLPYESEHNIKDIECKNEQCKKKWCIKCRKQYHGRDPCNKINTTDKNEIRKVIDEIIDNALIHKCPKCYTKYNKVSGCNKITCSSCGTHSCYLCGVMLTPTVGFMSVYSHFTAGNPCKLYNTEANTLNNETNVTNANIKFNNSRIEKELKGLIDINKDNADVVNIILDELARRGYPLETFKPVSQIIDPQKSLRKGDFPQAVKKTAASGRRIEAKKRDDQSLKMRLRNYGSATDNLRWPERIDIDSDSSDSDSSDSDDIDIDLDDNNRHINNRINRHIDRQINRHVNTRSANKPVPIQNFQRKSLRVRSKK